MVAISATEISAYTLFSRENKQHDIEDYISFKTTMSDGVGLDTFVFSSNINKRQPVILIRTPYSLKNSGINDIIFLKDFGYTIVVQNTRWGKSIEYRHVFLNKESKHALDSQDCINHILKSKFCDGNIGMWGFSASSIIGQLSLESDGLKASYLISPTNNLRDDAIITNSVLRTNIIINKRSSKFANFIFKTTYKICNYLRSFFPKNDCHYKEKAPSIYITGWYDFFLNGTCNSFLEHKSPNASLIIGPWNHFVNSPSFGDMKVSKKENILPINFEVKNFFDRFLKNNEKWNNPRCLYYVLNKNCWKQSKTWPVPCHWLSIKENDFIQKEKKTLEHDFYNLVENKGGWSYKNPSGPYNQNFIKDHKSVLIIKTKPIKKRTILTGYCTAKAMVKTDITFPLIARLCFIHNENILPIAQDIQKVTKTRVYKEVNFKFSPTSIELNNGMQLAIIFSSSLKDVFEAFPKKSGTIYIDNLCLKVPIEKEENKNLFNL